MIRAAWPLLLTALAVAAWSCGGDSDGDGAGGGDDALATPEEQYIIVGDCPPEPKPTGEDRALVPGLLVVGFAQDTDLDTARAYLDAHVTDYYIGTLKFEEGRYAIVCVEPGTEDAVTRTLPLGNEATFVNRYRIGVGY